METKKQQAEQGPACDTCHDQGEVWTGENQSFGYMSMQPPEPIMEPCPECSGDNSAPGVSGRPILPPREARSRQIIMNKDQFDRLFDCLQFYVEEDDVNPCIEGNDYWIEGYNKSAELLNEILGEDRYAILGCSKIHREQQGGDS